MKRFISLNYLLVVVAILLSSFIIHQHKRPTLFVIGDSTVKNGKGDGGNGLWGWADFLKPYFDTTKIAIENHALGGTSSRTFQTQGLWNKVLAKVQTGDYVMMQFGHNEGSKPDTSKNGYRGVLRGIGEDTVVLTWADGKLETVHSYGWYIRKFIRDVKEKGANPVVLSLITRNDWKDGKVLRSVNSFGQYAAEVAKQEGAWFIDLNSITADKYDAMGAEKVKPFFPQEHTHTNYDGARINAASVTEGLQLLTNCSLQKYLLSH